jgi:L-amino acid N-acyltransferase YncA
MIRLIAIISTITHSEMTMPPRIRQAVGADASGVVNVINPIIQAGGYTAFDTPFSVEAERRYIETLPGRGIFHVALREETIVGFQSMEPFATYTHAFDHVGVLGTYVELSCRRQGIGSALFEATFAEARRKDYEKLFTYILVHNAAALAAYTKQGFSIVGTARRHAKVKNAYSDMFVVERLL